MENNKKLIESILAVVLVVLIVLSLYLYTKNKASAPVENIVVGEENTEQQNIEVKNVETEPLIEIDYSKPLIIPATGESLESLPIFTKDKIANTAEFVSAKLDTNITIGNGISVLASINNSSNGDEQKKYKLEFLKEGKVLPISPLLSSGCGYGDINNPFCEFSFYADKKGIVYYETQFSGDPGGWYWRVNGNSHEEIYFGRIVGDYAPDEWGDGQSQFFIDPIYINQDYFWAIEGPSLDSLGYYQGTYFNDKYAERAKYRLVYGIDRETFKVKVVAKMLR